MSGSLVHFICGSLKVKVFTPVTVMSAKSLFIIYVRLRTVLLLAVTSLGCCSNPLESSLKPDCKKVAMNSGKARMIAQPRMKSGKSVFFFFKSPS